jgi:GntR family transcriptional repressor for pyruvate dehydrogenase complex
MRQGQWDMEKQGFEPINKGTVVEQIIRSITDSIIKGKYTAGMKLPNEYELINEFQVSRNSLREAIKILSACGILEIRRGDGTYVCSRMNPSIFDTVVYSMLYDLKVDSNLLELRQIIDETTVHVAMEKITPEELEQLHHNIDDMVDAINENDIRKAQQCDLDFHMALIDSCKNVFFIRIVKGVYNIFERSIIENVSEEKEYSKAPKYHLAILKCIEEKKEQDIGKVVRNSLISWYKTAVEEQ